ncbi:MAG: choice-of-anchor J domain-containing protein [Crocinitomicaceae bacterium]
MKKLFTFLSAVTIATAASAQTYFEDDFEGGTLTANHAWTSQVVANPDAITGEWIYGTVGGNYAKLSNFDGANHILNTWLISPSIDLSMGTQVVMNFTMTKRYDGDDIVVHISNDYDGTSAPSSATWTDVTSLFTLDSDVGSWTFVPSGDGDISSNISGTSTYIAFEYIGSATDGSTWEIDNVNIQEGGTVIPTLSIYDIQYTLADPADSPEEGNTVTTSGVVTSISQEDSGDGYFIQDADGSWNGICINDATNTPNVGDSVEVTGVVEENFDFTRIGTISNFVNHGASTWQPTAELITSNEAATLEEYESVMVQILSTECTNDNAGFGLWETNDGSGVVGVDDDCFVNFGDLGNWYDLTGIISYSFSAYKINPRTGADQVVVDYATIVDNTINFDIYPNPATDLINLNVDANAIVAIYSLSGAKVLETTATKTIDVSSLEAGMYNIVVTANGTQSVEKLVIR